MVCVRADTAGLAITTVLVLTEVSCVPSNQNITVQIQTRGLVTPQLYARDLAITAAICFIGGVGLALLIVLVYRKKLKASKRQKEEEDGSSIVDSHLDVSEKRKNVLLQVSSNQPWNEEPMVLDTGFENPGGSSWSRVDERSSDFRCPDCSSIGHRGMRWNNRVNMDTEEDRQKRRMRMLLEEGRRRPGSQQGILNRDIPNKLHSLSNSSFQPQRENFSERPDTLPAYGTSRDTDRGYETLHCESCYRTYRPLEQRAHTSMRDSALFDGIIKHNPSDMMKNTELRRDTRNVTFDLKSLRCLQHRKLQGKDNREEEKARTSRDEEKGREGRHKPKMQSSQLLKVKLNLNPLQRSKVHPKRKNEQDQSKKRSSKKSNEKRQNINERKRKSRKKTKGSCEKTKKSTKNKRSSQDDEEEKVEEDRGEEKSTATSYQEEITSKNDQCGQESSAGDQGKNGNPDNPQSADITGTADQSASVLAVGQVQNLHGGVIHSLGDGLFRGSAELSSMHPTLFSAVERTGATNLSVLGSAGSQLTGSSLSLQGGSFLLSTMVPGSTALLPEGPANSVAPSIAISKPSVASSGSLDSFSRQTEVGLIPTATSSLANTVHGNTVQASAVQTASLHNSQAGGLNLAANPTINLVPIQSILQSQLPFGNSPLVARLKSDPGQEPGLWTGQGLHQLPRESQAPQTNESLPVQAQVPPNKNGLSGVIPQALGSVTTVESLSNSQIDTGPLPGGSVVNMLAGGAALAEGPAAVVSGDGVQAADLSVLGDESSTGEAAAAAVLLHQEYLSEEGDSSRKLRLALPEKTSSQPPTALERKIR